GKSEAAIRTESRRPPYSRGAPGNSKRNLEQSGSIGKMERRSAIPQDLGPGALARLGEFKQMVVAYVDRLNRIDWLSKAGAKELWDGEVERVWSREAALLKARESMSLADTVFDALGRIG